MRPEIAQRIKEAKELGDLSENAEYDSAKEAQALNEGRIEDIKSTLESAVIITGNNLSGTVGVGSGIKSRIKRRCSLVCYCWRRRIRSGQRIYF